MARQRLYASDAERQAAFRARHEKQSLTVLLPADVIAAIRQKVKKHQSDGDGDMTLDKYVENLIRNQVMRKR